MPKSHILKRNFYNLKDGGTYMIFDSLFNDTKRILKKGNKVLAKIRSYDFSNLTDEELINKTAEFKDRLSKGETLDDIQAEAYAVAGEAVHRELGFNIYDNQYLSAYVIHDGNVAEASCGTGKTVVGYISSYLEALAGKGVHIITVNEYLAQRDAEECRRVYSRLGMTVGLNLAQMPGMYKQQAYNCDVTYTTNSELGFDYLRDNMVTDISRKVQRGLNIALIDEADSVLIDDARTPLIISAPSDNPVENYAIADRFVKLLKEEDYSIDVESNAITLTDEGNKKLEKMFGVDNLYSLENVTLVHDVSNALRANYVMKKDVDYVVEDNQVFIIDASTGRKMEGREWSNGLHQAVQAKEGVEIKPETKTVATITYQNFFRLYQKLAGMTGTAKTEEEEFLHTYNMRVVEIPPNRPVIRKDLDDKIFPNKRAKYNAIVRKIKKIHETGQPILVGTISVQVSETISKMLDREHIPHETLNAKNHAREAEIIAKAGQKGAVTVATNMAGRGTDIKLGEGVPELGGLYVLGTERHEARRIDNQLRGRSGRQGDPGVAEFYVSLEDDLMQRFGTEAIKALLDEDSEEEFGSRTISKGIQSAQERVEGSNFDIRKALSEYDDVIRQQREIYYKNRDEVLTTDDVHSLLKDMVYSGVKELKESVSEKELKEMLIKSGFEKEFNMETLADDIWSQVEEREGAVNNAASFERKLILNTTDTLWQTHIDNMSHLKDGMRLKHFSKENPLGAYINEAYDMYNNFLFDIKKQVVLKCCEKKSFEEANNIGTFIIGIGGLGKKLSPELLKKE